MTKLFSLYFCFKNNWSLALPIGESQLLYKDKKKNKS